MIKRFILCLAILVLALGPTPESIVRLLPDTDEAEARGRGGGRAAGRAGGFRGHTRSRPSGAKMHSRPTTRPRTTTRPRPTTRPNNGIRPSRPSPSQGSRPHVSRPSQLPAKTRPATRPPGDRPGFKPPGDRPGARPPGTRPPGNRPPGSRPPGHRPPGVRPPGNRPPGWRPPGWRPPGARPPGWRPPYYRPPYARPPNHYWGAYNWYPRWGWYFTAVTATTTLVFIATLPDDKACEEVLYEGETLYLCDGVLYRPVYHDDQQVYEIVSEADASGEAAPSAQDAPAQTDPVQTAPPQDPPEGQVGDGGFRWTD